MRKGAGCSKATVIGFLASFGLGVLATQWWYGSFKDIPRTGWSRSTFEVASETISDDRSRNKQGHPATRPMAEEELNDGEAAPQNGTSVQNQVNRRPKAALSFMPTPDAEVVQLGSNEPEEIASRKHGQNQQVNKRPKAGLSSMPTPTAEVAQLESNEPEERILPIRSERKHSKRPSPALSSNTVPTAKISESDVEQGEESSKSEQKATHSVRPMAKPGKYVPDKRLKFLECSVQATNFGGIIKTIEECDKVSAGDPECGDAFMWSVNHPDWQCRCCAPDGAEEGPPSEHWDVYNTQYPRAAPPKAKADEPIEGGLVPIPNRECAAEAVDFRRLPSVKVCDYMTANTEACGGTFMYNLKRSSWGCRCCAKGEEEEEGKPSSQQWSLFKIVSPRPKVFGALPTMPPFKNPFRGLPVAPGPRPSWLIKEDELVVDTRSEKEGGGILILQAVLADARADWGKSESRPHWLRAILATNRNHVRRHGHALVLRAQPSQPQLTQWQWRDCKMKQFDKCIKDNERENFNWEKHKMIGEYLHSEEQFSHVLMLDADAALVNREHDTLRDIAQLMETRDKDVFLTDEDWLENGAGRINGGLMFVKNTEFARNLFLDTFDAHLRGNARLGNWRIGVRNMECSSNEQICLNDLWQGTGKPQFAPHAMMASGKVYNRGAERGGDKFIDSPDVEVMHWMGGSKGSAGRTLCLGARDFTGDGPQGYGCKMNPGD